MPGRPKINAAAPTIRSSFADAAFAVEERVVWGGADLLRSLLDAVKWPFERAAWTVERALVWPLEERTDDWSGSVRAAGVAALALLATGAGVLGLVWASGGGGGSTTQVREVSSPAATVRPLAAPVQPARVLHGPTPNFKATTKGDGSKLADETTSKGAGEAKSTTSATGTTPETSTTATAAPVVPAGPAATAVAHRFAEAFVLYETGQGSAKVRVAFAVTASPRLAHALLRRPPRLPANTKVPKAKVLNIVPGPKHADTYTMSISLLRVGVTSELRIGMQQDKHSHTWQVKEIDG